MSILTHFPNITLTADQQIAVEKLSTFLESDDRVFILQGYAGSGKTTLLKGIVEYLQSLEGDELFAALDALSINKWTKNGEEYSKLDDGWYVTIRAM